jgi:hypothetical protein
MQMTLRPRLIKAPIAPAAVFVVVLALMLAAAVPAGAAPARAFTADTKTKVTVKVVACRSNAFYDNRQLTFRASMSRADVAVPQTLEMRVDVLRKFKREKRYKRIKADGLGIWSGAKDPAATGFQRDVQLTDPDTAALYRAKVSFRWRDPATQKVQAHKTVLSRICKQKVELPRLSIGGDVMTLVPGASTVQHSLTLVNRGPSEAVLVPVAIYIDGNPPITRIIESVGPKSSFDSKIETPACATGYAYAVIDPQKTLAWLPAAARAHVLLTRCR